MKPTWRIWRGLTLHLSSHDWTTWRGSCWGPRSEASAMTLEMAGHESMRSGSMWINMDQCSHSSPCHKHKTLCKYIKVSAGSRALAQLHPHLFIPSCPELGTRANAGSLSRVRSQAYSVIEIWDCSQYSQTFDGPLWYAAKPLIHCVVYSLVMSPVQGTWRSNSASQSCGVLQF